MDWVALGAVGTWVGAAFTAYGKYNEVFGPAKEIVDWNRYIVASERRIITAINQAQFQKSTRELNALALWWNRDCVDFLKKNPISPKNIEAIDKRIDIKNLEAKIGALDETILYFAGDAPGDYGTYGALATAYTLMYIFMTARETYFIAKNNEKSGSKAISRTIAAGITAIKAWPAHYFVERAKHMSIEIETKHQGGGGITGRAGNKRTTGWYIVHDTVNDPAVGTFNDKRFHHVFPNTVQMVTDQYKISETAKAVSTLLKQWEKLHAQALQAETSPLPSSTPQGVNPFKVFESTNWYRLQVFLSPYPAIGVVSNPSTNKTDAQLQLLPEAEVPGQLWQLRRSQTSIGSWNLCTLLLGTSMCLDVYGDDKTRPHLAPAGNFSGQQWQIIDRHDGSWSLANSYSGPSLLLDAGSSGELRLSERQEESRTQKWILFSTRKITEEGF
ncbi:MAG: hypothetical protein M1840_001996 [Geoglossum simile]|nr:MAG: hypothetical protein M1840_001996 [Geoglossum simile]